MGTKGRLVKFYSTVSDRSDVVHMIAELFNKDGGPGSGNFGHKGRPGKVGGSGPGGGKQYRGGRADIGYFNSRNDWLNGLTGERQHEASQIMKKISESVPPTMIPEEYIMKKWPLEARESFLGLVGEARSWKDRGFKLANENLDEDERFALISIMNHLENKFDPDGEKGLITDEEWLNNDLDRVFGLMTDEEQEYYLDAKAKACGLPTSGKDVEDYSEEFLRETGLQKENHEWITRKSIPEDEKKAINDLIDRIGITADRDDMDDVEKQLEAAMVRDLAQHKRETIDLVREYTRRKQKLIKVNAEEILAKGNSPHLNEFQRKFCKEVLETSAGKLPAGETVENVADIAEEKFFRNKDVSDIAKEYYLAMKLRVLGHNKEKPEEDLIQKVNGDFLQAGAYYLECAIKPMKENGGLSREDKKKADLEKYEESRKQTKIVIDGDSFSEGVEKLRKPEGTYTAEEIHSVGKLALSEFDKEWSKLKRKADKLEVRKNEMREKWFNGELEYGEYSKICKEYNDIVSQSPVVGILSRVRKTGIDEKTLKGHMEGRWSPSKQYLYDAYQAYPTDWIQKSIDYGSVEVRKVSNRGSYGGWVVKIDGDGRRAKEVATHELGHRFEEVIPGIKAAEKSFYDKRTEGEELVPLRNLTGNKGYRTDEKTRKDNFVSPYIGKDYEGSWYEVVSMGFQYAFHAPEKLMQDKEYASLILGLLCVA